ncbi:Gfo/Idh/MocA family oxidoreductase [Rhodocytophaga rosea]|uniref:Gfo/Idh/MocA family oxidoreductase n=1 Tax=Rhodocytophaga rosea TaxID=2704465 RepID=A0A6C0GRF7_9BACT|nr:Gfo/Idh/MocA family oxidoreductase [Rhodocytophaga rosea]QHT70649.1 Gfo/Idh/MocA family oxidoreductase [Rhodocytophaga rosea]
MKEDTNMPDKTSRRTFLKATGTAVLANAIALNLSMPTHGLAANKTALKVGLIGCGGRGTGAATQALKADPDVVLTAMADVFPDRLEESYQALFKIFPKKLKINKGNKFVGFDAYKKVIESDVDVVLLATPPSFRPDHLMAAVNAGKHVFCEKPVAVDAPGVRKVLEAAKKVKEKNLSLLSGFCFRYDLANRATFGKVLNGDIGEIRMLSTTRNGGPIWNLPRQPEWTDMEYQMRNWYYYNWLSGDFIVEQAVHSLDLMSWAMGDKAPVKASGSGGRQVRTDAIYGNIYDHFAIEYEYENGVKGYHFTRQQEGCSTANTVDIAGTQGSVMIDLWKGVHEIRGANKWLYRGEKNDMYQTEHDEFFASIRNGKPMNDGEWMATSTMLAVLGRMVAYTGQTITWQEALNSNQVLGPETDQFTWQLKWPGPGIATPGITKQF